MIYMITEIKPDERILLDFIAKLEAGGNYNAVYGSANSQQDLSKYTLRGIQDKQRRHGRITGSSAFGAYQFIRKTLKGLIKELKLDKDQLFTPALQDKLAVQLLQRRGLERWREGGLSDSSFMDNLSKEWASLPYHTGKSYYDGDGLNHALASRHQFRAVVEAARRAYNPMLVGGSRPLDIPVDLPTFRHAIPATAAGEIAGAVIGGSDTDAIKSYQRDLGLVADGVIGPDTWLVIAASVVDAFDSNPFRVSQVGG